MYAKVKPNMLVFVNLRDITGYHYFGQVMSMPIPHETTPCSEHKTVDGSCHECAMNQKGDTAMVRRVAGHPGTLVELPVHYFEEVQNPARLKWVHYAEVLGPGKRSGPTDTANQFPVDMLRYDCAAPVNFSIVDDNYYGKVATPIDPAFGFEQRVIACLSEHRDAARAWTPARWSSFLWAIRPLKTLHITD